MAKLYQKSFGDLMGKKRNNVAICIFHSVYEIKLMKKISLRTLQNTLNTKNKIQRMAFRSISKNPLLTLIHHLFVSFDKTGKFILKSV